MTRFGKKKDSWSESLGRGSNQYSSWSPSARQRTLSTSHDQKEIEIIELHCHGST